MRPKHRIRIRLKNWVQDLPIFWKLLALPIVSLVTLLAIIGTDHVALNIVTNSSNAIYEDQFKPTVEAMEVAAEVNRAIADLYLAFALAEDREDLNAIAAQLDDVRNRLKESLATIELLASETTDPELSERLQNVAKALQDFDQPIAFMRDLLDVDARAALDFLEPLQTQLDLVQADLEYAVFLKKDSASDNIARISDTAVTTEFLGASLAVVYLVIFFILTPVFIRSVRASIDRIASATQSLAQGDLGIDIEGLRRKDEMGKIVESLVVFRDSLVDREKLSVARKQIEEELLTANVKLSSVVDALNAVQDQLLIETADGKLTYLNHAATQMNALKESMDSYGKPFRDAVPMIGAIREKHTDEITAVLSQEGIWQRELKLSFPGRNEIGNYDVRAIKLPQGGTIYSVRDVTAQTVAAKREQELRSQLSEAQKMQAIGHLAGGIAHDFNNMIAAIQGFASLIEQDSKLDDKTKSYARRIVKVCKRAATLVREILLFARAEKAEKRTLRLKNVVDKVCSDLIPTLSRATPVVVRLGSNALNVEGSESQISQVITNLITNSAHACEEGNGKIFVYMSDRAVSDAELTRFANPRNGRLFQKENGSLRDCYSIGNVVPGQAYVTVTIADKGEGMSAASLQRAFETFYTTKEDKGTGLGLSVVERIMIAHGGALEAQSSEGKGTRVRLYFPVSENSTSVTFVEEEEHVHGERNARVMIVDDDEDVADTLSLGLSSMGYQTTVLYQPSQAFEVFSSNPSRWDVVVTDQVMGQHRGLDLISKMRTLRPKGTYILMTGYDETLTAESALEQGVSAYFEKPLELSDLSTEIERLLKEARRNTSNPVPPLRIVSG